MKVTSDIFLVGGPSLSHSSDAAAYLIRSGGDAALVDCGTGKGHGALIKNIRAAGTEPGKVSRLFLTHCHYDHTGGANKMKESTGCEIVAHRLCAEYIEAGDSAVTAALWYGTYMEPTPVDVKVSEKEASFALGGMEVRFYHAPGHSPGSSVLTVVSDGLLVLFGQDVHGPLNDELRSVREDYLKSLEFMLSLNADVLCEGHFGIYAGKEKVRDFIESFL